MPLSTNVPPWLNVGPTDYLHAIQAGTQAGLEVNRQRALAEEAAARRELAQQEAQRQAWEFGETMRQRAAQQAAEQALEREKLAQTGQYQSGLLDWHNEQARLAAEKAAQQAQNQSEILGIRTENLGLAQQRMDAQQRQFDEMQKLREEAAGMKIDLAQQAILAGEQKRLEALNQQIANIEEGGVTDRPKWWQSGFGLSPGEKPEYDKLVEAKTALEQDLMRRFGRGGGIPASPAIGTGEPTIDTQAAYDALAPGTVYRGKDGKRYRKP